MGVLCPFLEAGLRDIYRSVRLGLLRSLGGPKAIGRLYATPAIRRLLRAARDGRMSPHEVDALSARDTRDRQVGGGLVISHDAVQAELENLSPDET